MESYELFFLGLQESSDELEHASKAFHLSRFFYEKPRNATQEQMLYLIKAILFAIDNKDILKPQEDSILEKITNVY